MMSDTKVEAGWQRVGVQLRGSRDDAASPKYTMAGEVDKDGTSGAV
jgi:hypothetical protein